MQVEPTAAAVAQIPVNAVRLRVGARVVARVVAPAGAGGQGELALAGAVVRARLPKGLRRGQRLTLQVAGQVGEQLVLRMVQQAKGTRRRGATRLASALATRRDGELLRVALALTDGRAVPLPGQRLVALDRDAGGADATDESDGAIRLTLHTPELGAVEMIARLVGERVQVTLVVDQSVVDAARGEVGVLATRLEASSGHGAVVTVQARRGPAPRPPELELAEDERYG